MTLIAKLIITDLIVLISLFIASSTFVSKISFGPATLLEKVILVAIIVSLIILPILAIIAVWVSTPYI